MTTPVRVSAAGAAIAVVALIGCQAVAPAASSDAGGSPSQAAAAGTETPAASDAAAVTPLPLPSGISVRDLSGRGWRSTAQHVRGRNGDQFLFACPAQGQGIAFVWGTDVYTDDSFVCWAAVHSGHITEEAGGVITIELRPGQSRYEGSLRNGVETRGYPNWHRSFVVVAAEPY
jgi:hypothetical protein